MADQSIGTVKTLNGTAEVVHPDGSAAPLHQGDALHSGDVVKTAAGAGVGMVLSDGTSLSLGENGRMSLDDVAYDPGTKVGEAHLSLQSGAFALVSGRISKATPDAMSIKTPSMTVGIRGTGVAGNGNIVALMQEKGGQVGELLVTTPSGQAVTLNQPGQGASLGAGGSLSTVSLSPIQVMSIAGTASFSLPNASNLLSNSYSSAASVVQQQIQQQQQQQQPPPPPLPPPPPAVPDKSAQQKGAELTQTVVAVATKTAVAMGLVKDVPVADVEKIGVAAAPADLKAALDQIAKEVQAQVEQAAQFTTATTTTAAVVQRVDQVVTTTTTATEPPRVDYTIGGAISQHILSATAAGVVTVATTAGGTVAGGAVSLANAGHIVFSDGTVTIAGSAGNLSLVGGTGGETLHVGSGFKTVLLGTGNDSLTMALSDVTGLGTLRGGVGADTLTITGVTGTLSDSAFVKTDGFETVVLKGIGDGTLSLGSQTVLSGISTIDASSFNNLTLTGTGYAGGHVTLLGGSGAIALGSGLAGTLTLEESGAPHVMNVSALPDGSFLGARQAGNDLQIQFASSAGGGTLIVENQYAATPSGIAYLTGHGGTTSLIGLLAGAGSTALTGTSGDDVFVSNAQVTAMTGGGGDDTFFLADANQVVTGDSVEGGQADFTYVGAAVTYLHDSGQATFGGHTTTLVNIDRVVGSAYGDVLNAGSAPMVLEGGAGNNTLIGSNSNTTASYRHALTGIYANLTDQALPMGGTLVQANHVLNGYGGTDSLSGITSIRGSAYADRMVGGDSGSYTLDGNGGADILIGGAGDTVFRIKAGDGATVIGGSGTNVLAFDDFSGGTIGAAAFEHVTGVGTLALWPGDGNVSAATVTLDAGAGAGVGIYVVSAQDWSAGATVDATLTSGNITMYGGSGDDTLRGNGTGTNVLVESGSLASAVIHVNSNGPTTIVGADGTDVISGDTQEARFSDGTLYMAQGGAVLVGALSGEHYVVDGGSHAFGFDAGSFSTSGAYIDATNGDETILTLVSGMAAVTDGDFAHISGVETLSVGPFVSGTVALGSWAVLAGIETVDLSQDTHTQNITLDAYQFTGDLTIQAGSAVETIIGGQGDDRVVMSRNAGDIAFLVVGGMLKATDNSDIHMTDVRVANVESFKTADGHVIGVSDGPTTGLYTLRGEEGSDVINAGNGIAVIDDGGGGNDVFSNVGGGSLTFQFHDSFDQYDTVSGGGSDTLALGDLKGDAVADVAFSHVGGIETLTLSHGTVVLANHASGAGVRVVDASSSSDGVSIDAGADATVETIIGGSGDDTITAGANSSGETLTGGAGADTFVIKAGTGTADHPLVITDFSSGEDQLNLAAAETSLTYYTKTFSGNLSDAVAALSLSTSNNLVFMTDGTDGYLVFMGGGLDGEVVKLAGVTTAPNTSDMSGAWVHDYAVPSPPHLPGSNSVTTSLLVGAIGDGGSSAWGSTPSVTVAPLDGLIDDGSIDPGGAASAGTLSIVGDLTLESRSHVTLDLAVTGDTDAGHSDLVTVSGTLVAGGELHFSNHYGVVTDNVGQHSDPVTVMTWGDLEGAFSALTGMSGTAALSNGSGQITHWLIDPVFGTTGLSLSVLSGSGVTVLGANDAFTDIPNSAAHVVGNGSNEVVDLGSGADVYIGHGGFNRVGVSDTAFHFLDGGSGGNNQLVWEGGGGTNFNLVGMAANVAQNFDILNLLNSNASATLDVTHVLAMTSGTNAVSATSHSLIVVGGNQNDSHSINFSDGGWRADGQMNLTVNGHQDSYTQYTNGDAHVLVQNNVHVG